MRTLGTPGEEIWAHSVFSIKRGFFLLTGSWRLGWPSPSGPRTDPIRSLTMALRSCTFPAWKLLSRTRVWKGCEKSQDKWPRVRLAKLQPDHVHGHHLASKCRLHRLGNLQSCSCYVTFAVTWHKLLCKVCIQVIKGLGGTEGEI